MDATLASPCRIVVLISGRGSNMQTIVDTIKNQGLAAQVSAVISNKPEAAGLEWARAQGIRTDVVAHRDYPSREEFDVALAQAIDKYDAHYVLLAGFMRVLTPGFVERFNGRLINIHPSLLPAFPGLHTHQQALATGVQWHGCTVHFVTPVLSADTPDDLAARVLAVEHRMYADVVRWLSEGRVTLDAMQRVHVRGVASRSFVLTPQGVESSERST